MDDLSRNTCALLDETGERIARGRYEFFDEKTWAKFTPASIVPPPQMARAAFLWPDGEERTPLTDTQPFADNDRHYRLNIKPSI